MKENKELESQRSDVAVAVSPANIDPPGTNESQKKKRKKKRSLIGESAAVPLESENSLQDSLIEVPVSEEDSKADLTENRKKKKKKKHPQTEDLESFPMICTASPDKEHQSDEHTMHTKNEPKVALIEFPASEGDSMADSTKSSKKKKKTKHQLTVDQKNENQVEDDTHNSNGQQTPESETTVAGFFSNEKFDCLPVSENMKKALKEMEFDVMTKIQAKSIPPLLGGEDLVGSAKTGSGKTLAFLIPALELLNRTNFSHRNGAGCIVISPTRELSLQTYGVLRELCSAGGFPQTHGLLIGGANRKAEAEKLSRGVNLLICTPGRLLDHLQNSRGFLFANLQILVLDEADRMLEQGFEEELHQIVKILPKERQTILFSATQTKKVEDLAKLSIQKRPVYVGVDDEASQATVSSLEQGYVVCPSDNRFLLLFTFLKKNKNKKVMVFFSSCNSVKFHSELLNYIDIPVMDIHGRQKQQKRTTTFFQFCRQKTGTLLCTDVAARGLDIPAVDWIVQYDPPDQPAEYIHRVGRTARGASGSGRALLFLCPEEVGFLKYLRAAKVSLNEYEFPANKVANVGTQLCRLVEKNYYLNRSAREAYKSYLLAYASHAHKHIFNVHELDLQAVGKAFGFTVPPRVDVNFSAKGAKGRIKKGMKQKEHQKVGHGFSASNPYGKRAVGDNRQFVH